MLTADFIHLYYQNNTEALFVYSMPITSAYHISKQVSKLCWSLAAIRLDWLDWLQYSTQIQYKNSS